MSKQTPEAKNLTPERLVDLVPFFLGYEAYSNWLNEGEHEDGPFTAKDAGARMAYRYLKSFEVTLEAVLGPVLAQPAAAILVPLRERALQGGVRERAQKQGIFLRRLFQWFHTRDQVLRNTFPGRALKSARTIMSIAEEESPRSLVNRLSAIPPVSGLRGPRKWLKVAADEMGAPLTSIEDTLVMVEAATHIARQIQQVEGDILNATPNSEEAADLQAEKASLVEQLEQVAEDSPAPGTVIQAAAAAAAATAPITHRTQTGKELGLTPQQEAAMVAKGKKVIAAGAGSGKCIVGDTLIQTEWGFLPIGDLGAHLESEKDTPLEMVVHGKGGPEKTSHIYFDGFRTTRRIETRQGYVLEGTGPHKILALRAGFLEWIKLDDFEEGDVVCIDRRPGLFAEQPYRRTPDAPESFLTNATPETNIPEELTPQVASLLGWIVSEGYIRKNAWNISLTTTEPEQRALYLEAMEGLVTPTEREDLRHTKQYVLNLHRSADIRALLGFGLTRTLAGEKEVPKGILRSPKPVVRAFLQSLFDGDGGVTQNTIEYVTASEVLAQQVHTLLAAFGIPCRRKFRPNKGQGTWHLILSGFGLRQFASEIGFGLKDKAEKLDTLVQRGANTNVDVIPGIAGICRVVQDQYAKKHGTTRTKEAGYGTFSCLVKGSRNPSFSTLERFLDFYPVENSEEWETLKALSTSSWFFDPVHEITEHEAPVYDFVVPGTHSFSANGFINHNTRVLAGEIAYRINEEGYDPTAICAVSFTRKAAGELVARIQDYGAVIQGPAKNGFGTTHNVAGILILRQYGKEFTRPHYFGRKEGWAPTTLIALAVRQVGMRSSQGGGANAPAAKGYFTGGTPDKAEQPATPPPSIPNELDIFLQNLRTSMDFFRYGWPSSWQGGRWAQDAYTFMDDIGFGLVRQGRRLEELSSWQREKLRKLFDKTPGLKNAPIPTTSGPPRVAHEHWAKTAADDFGLEPGEGEKLKRKGISNYVYFKDPANQWFNLGIRWDGDGNQRGREAEQFSASAVKKKIGIWKGKGASPSEAWHAVGPCEGEEKYTPEAAAYAAYEWLKGPQGEPDFRNKGDLSDLLHDAVRTLIHSKRARTALQSRFKVILGDEAQDLNRVQHLLFGLLAGYLDHTTLQPKADGSMTADVFGLIGDDKQAIYEFRGANPNEFIDKSDLAEEAGDFDTYLLDTNYRSGQAIIDAANQLISHNSKQIPMTCKANYEVKGDGAIRAITVSSEEAGEYVAKEILDSVAMYSGEKKWGNFGVAVRSNAEADMYALGMIQNGIPFKTKINPFRAPHLVSMLGWMTLVEQGPDGDQIAIRSALKDAVSTPTSYLGSAFKEHLDRQHNPISWLLNGGYTQTITAANYRRRVASFAANVEVCLKYHGTDLTPKEIYDRLLTELAGADGETFLGSLENDIQKDNGKMAELAAENENGIPTKAQIIDAAEEQMTLVNAVMQSKDTVPEIMSYIRKLQRVNDKVAKDDDGDDDAVVIGTMHSWKGLEVPKMFIPMVRGKFPRAKIAKNPITGQLECEPPDPNDPALASERRLAYVAITRAEDDAVILDIPHPKLPCGRSQFISEGCIPLEGFSVPAEKEVGDDEELPGSPTKLANLEDEGTPWEIWDDVEDPPSEEFIPWSLRDDGTEEFESLWFEGEE